ncbi:alpha/beta hydrolase [Frondihabitans cladoniiphilus]|uniref:Alpha/beta hydrolase fold-3 domain-containing protein n=1 Tax=Frondihabitans cladoniiphilus TaxID=715785 RepID=A0ABP8VNP3_9MICO
MPIEPTILTLLADIRDIEPRAAASSAEARRAAMAGAHDALLSQVPAYPSFPDVDVTERTVVSGGRAIPVRVFTPAGSGPFPAYLFFFGGAWWQRSFDAGDIVDACAHAAQEGRAVVIEVDYRLAPEHPYPAALDDAAAVLQWISDAADDLGIDTRRIAVGGQSSGGNLAAALCLRNRDEDGPEIGLQILEVPALTLDRAVDAPRLDTAVESDEESGFPEAIRYYLSGDPVAALDPYVSPLLADDVSGLPEALILTAEHDVLRNEALRYAARLANAGVPTTAVTYAGQVHFTPALRTLTPSGRAWRGQVAQALRDFGAVTR